MVQTPIKPITLEEFLAMPETKPASEYIDGQVIQKPMPQGQHSIIQFKLAARLDLAFESQDVAEAFTELRCTFGNRALIPDLSVFESARVPRDSEGTIKNVFSIAPDWTIEILSPGQSAPKVLKNINHCLAHGTQMGWLIDPESKSVTISRTGQNILILDDPIDVLPVPEFARVVELSIGTVFGWLKKQAIIQ
jgi:Uma2 family endonuclease